MLRCFGIGGPRGGAIAGVNVPKVVQRRDVDRAASEASVEVLPWDESRMVLVRDLQKAINNYGRVQLFTDSARDGEAVAVKRMPTRWVCSGSREFDARYAGARERPWFDIGLVRALGDMQYPYACRLHGIFRSDVETFVATSFCEGGDLFEWCFRETLPGPGAEREAQIRPIAVQLVDAVRWLHDLGVAHRDLSLENAMLVRSGAQEEQVKLIDFGMATLQRTSRYEAPGKRSYQAPEIHGDGPVDWYLADAFALGAMLCMMDFVDYPWACTVRGSCPHFDYAQRYGLRRLLGMKRLQRFGGQLMSEVISKDFLAVLEALLHFAPARRACLGEAAFSDDWRHTAAPSLPYFTAAAPPRLCAPQASSTASTCASASRCASSSAGSWASSSGGRSPQARE